ncbi:MAG TPA: hypothetical protein VFI53_00350 [Myxococcaceae bacterium]|nr:hypothetical protein [Myxococcaceae bacterium]
MQNLRDKLLKAGLVSAEQAAKAEKTAEPAPRPERRRERPEHPNPGAKPGGPMLVARLQPLSAVPKLPPLPGSKASQRLEAKRQRFLDSQLRERVLAAQVPVEPGERAFYFVTRKNRLRRLELSDAQAEALEQGRLAVVERPDPAQIEHALVPGEVALGLVKEFPKAVRFLNAPGSPVGFLSDEEVKARAAAEAAETPEERAALDAPQSEEQRAEEAADAADAEGSDTSASGTEPREAGETSSAAE